MYHLFFWPASSSILMTWTWLKISVFFSDTGDSRPLRKTVFQLKSYHLPCRNSNLPDATKSETVILDPIKKFIPSNFLESIDWQRWKGMRPQDIHAAGYKGVVLQIILLITFCFIFLLAIEEEDMRKRWPTWKPYFCVDCQWPSLVLMKSKLFIQEDLDLIP